MIYWAQLFHFYQPPNQTPSVLDKICHESYRPLLEVFRQHPHIRVTVNINGVLLDLLHECGHRDIIAGLRELGGKGQVEFTGSGKYHPILPLLPQAERKRQIELNIKTSTYLLKKAYTPRGFFPPEVCYSNEIIPEILASGYQWLILSGVACPAPWPVDKIYQIEHEGQKLAVFFRDDILSNKISFKQTTPKDFLEHLEQIKGDNENAYIITAMDAETYGHHIRDWERLFLAAVYEQLSPTPATHAGSKQAAGLTKQPLTPLADAKFVQQIKTVTISELLEIFSRGDIISPKPSSWSSSAADIAASNPYPLWQGKDNEIHRLQWEHLHLCIEMVEKAQECQDNEESISFGRIARGLLDRAEYSCQFWWASRRPMWDLNLVHLGLIEQWRVIVNAYRAINQSALAAETKTSYYHKLVASSDLRNKIVDKLFVL